MDEKVDKLNAKIAKILGKRNNKQKNHTQNPQKHDDNDLISDFTYIIVTLLCLLILWIATGVYYVNVGTTAIIYNRGSVSEVINGPKFGVTLPYPFSDVDVVDTTVSDMLNLANSDVNYSAITKDGLTINLFTQFSYQLTNPLKLYSSYLVNTDNIENIVRYETQYVLHNFISQTPYENLEKSNLTLMGNSIKNMVNSVLAPSGVEVVKVNISKLQLANTPNTSIEPAINNNETLNPSMVAIKLIQQSKLYQADRIALTKNRIIKFNELFKLYQQNRQVTVDQMYKDTIDQIPVMKEDKYPLLSKSLAQLINLGRANISSATQNDASQVRVLNRSVNRERDLGQ